MTSSLHPAGRPAILAQVTEENVELARGVVGDLNALFELFDDDIVWDNTGYAPPDIRGVHRGREDVIEVLKKWVGTWTEYRFGIEETVEADDRIVLVASETGRGAGSGAPMEHHFAMVWTFEDGRIVRGAAYPSKAEALAAAGLSG